MTPRLAVCGSRLRRWQLAVELRTANRQPPTANANGGFTLVEVLIAFLILLLIVTMSLGAFLARNRRLQQAHEIKLAYQALANEAEYRRRVPFADLEEQPATFLSDTAILATLAPYTATVAVEEDTPAVKKVTMTVRWGEVAEARLGLTRADTGGSNFW